MPRPRLPFGPAVLALPPAPGPASHAPVAETGNPPPAALVPLERPVSFERDVEPVLERRCAVCHGCYDAPCQLLLTSHAGAVRGATKSPVYDNARLTDAAPTRLGIDAHGEEAWRARG